MRRARYVPALRHEHTLSGIAVTQVIIPAPPMAVVSPLESIVYGWWYRAGGYPVGGRRGSDPD